MFKKGDKIVYLKNILNIINHGSYYEKYKLKDLNNIKKYYTFDKYNEFSDNTIIYLQDYPGPVQYAFSAKDFMLLSEYRKIKLSKLSK